MRVYSIHYAVNNDNCILYINFKPGLTLEHGDWCQIVFLCRISTLVFIRTVFRGCSVGGWSQSVYPGQTLVVRPSSTFYAETFKFCRFATIFLRPDTRAIRKFCRFIQKKWNATFPIYLCAYLSLILCPESRRYIFGCIFSWWDIFPGGILHLAG